MKLLNFLTIRRHRLPFTVAEVVVIAALLIAFLRICFQNDETALGYKAGKHVQSNGSTLGHEEKNSVYYWKTVFVPDAADYAFFRKHHIRRIYLRMFDVACEKDYLDMNYIVPNATLKIPDDTYYQLKDSLPDMTYVPVVYITLEALKNAQYNEEYLAIDIVTRVMDMCSYHDITHVEGLQLDCDWTPSTEKSFFALCDSVRSYLKRRNLPWTLSSTIRLHQLAQKVPPVDYGVLMVYNTGNFSDPDVENSILSEEDVKPYLKYLTKYPLHLDVAYPTYSWQLLFRKRHFIGLLNGVEVTDTMRFRPRTFNTHIALTDMPYGRTIIYKDDVIRTEASDYQKLERVKNLIEPYMNSHLYNIILYHFDLKNLSKYSDYEIDYLFHTASGK